MSSVVGTWLSLVGTMISIVVLFLLFLVNNGVIGRRGRPGTCYSQMREVVDGSNVINVSSSENIRYLISGNVQFNSTTSFSFINDIDAIVRINDTSVNVYKDRLYTIAIVGGNPIFTL